MFGTFNCSHARSMTDTLNIGYSRIMSNLLNGLPFSNYISRMITEKIPCGNNNFVLMCK